MKRLNGRLDLGAVPSRSTINTL